MAEPLPLAAKRPPSAVQTPFFRILRLSQVIEATGLQKTTIYELQASGQFPMRVHITRHSVGWIDSEVQAWISERIARRRVYTRVRNNGSGRAPY
jgi:prophage regulatory protein